MIPEFRFVLLLARRTVPLPVWEESRALLSTGLNLNAIVGRVLAEDVYPLFYRNLLELESAEQGAKGKERGAWSPEHGARNDIAICELRDAESQGAQGERDQFAMLNINRPSKVSDQRPDVEGRGYAKNAINATNVQRQEPASSITVPESALQRLEKLSKINSFRDTLLVEELAGVLRLFSDAGIPAIPLKGPALAQALYGDASLRVCVDLDILVPRSMVRRAFSLLREDGYAGEFAPGFFADLLLRHDIEYGLRRQDRGFEFMVELHWGVSWGGKAEQTSTDKLWADAYPTTVFGAPAYALSPEWLILVLAAHAARHQWQGLKWLVDLHELYSAPNVDWEKLDKKAKQLGWEELLRISFLACRSLFETPIPAKYLVGELPSWVKLFPESAPVPLNGAFFATHLIQKRLDKLRYAARVLLIPTLAELRLVRFPALLSFLYYPLRPLRLLCKWGGRCLPRAGSLEQGARSLLRFRIANCGFRND